MESGENSATRAGWLERLGTAVDDVRLWFRNSTRLGVLMGKGAYLSLERRRSFQRLGRKAFERVQGGALQDPELEAEIQHITRLTKKLEIEERLVRAVRFGERRGRRGANLTEADKLSSSPTSDLKEGVD